MLLKITLLHLIKIVSSIHMFIHLQKTNNTHIFTVLVQPLPPPPHPVTHCNSFHLHLYLLYCAHVSSLIYSCTTHPPVMSHHKKQQVFDLKQKNAPFLIRTLHFTVLLTQPGSKNKTEQFSQTPFPSTHPLLHI